MTDNERVDAARDAITQAAQAYIEACYPDHQGAYLEGWVLTAGWTSVDLERTDRSGINTTSRRGQHYWTSRGLAELGADRYALSHPGEED